MLSARTVAQALPAAGPSTSPTIPIVIATRRSTNRSFPCGSECNRGPGTWRSRRSTKVQPEFVQ